MVSIEDPFDQDDFDAYKAMTESVGTGCQIVGDDLLVTNPTRVKKAIDEKACNALLLKVSGAGAARSGAGAARRRRGALASQSVGGTAWQPRPPIDRYRVWGRRSLTTRSMTAGSGGVVFLRTKDQDEPSWTGGVRLRWSAVEPAEYLIFVTRVRGRRRAFRVTVYCV